jgi:hypothetical protein
MQVRMENQEAKLFRNQKKTHEPGKEEPTQLQSPLPSLPVLSEAASRPAVAMRQS